MTLSSLTKFCIVSCRARCVAKARQHAFLPLHSSLSPLPCPHDSAAASGPYSTTVRLPTTPFSLRANSPVREPQIQAHWEETRTYQQLVHNNPGVGQAGGGLLEKRGSSGELMECRPAVCVGNVVGTDAEGVPRTAAAKRRGSASGASSSVWPRPAKPQTVSATGCILHGASGWPLLEQLSTAADVRIFSWCKPLHARLLFRKCTPCMMVHHTPTATSTSAMRSTRSSRTSSTGACGTGLERMPKKSCLSS